MADCTLFSDKIFRKPSEALKSCKGSSDIIHLKVLSNKTKLIFIAIPFNYSFDNLRSLVNHIMI